MLENDNVVARRYIVERDEKKKIWKIYDALHPDLALGVAEAEIPDNHPAVKILNEQEWIELVQEAARLGLLEANVANTHDKAVVDTQQKSQELKLNRSEKMPISDSSELQALELRRHAIDAIVKLIGSYDVTGLTK